jgi:hypothetical protein
MALDEVISLILGEQAARRIKIDTGIVADGADCGMDSGPARCAGQRRLAPRVNDDLLQQEPAL